MKNFILIFLLGTTLFNCSNDDDYTTNPEDSQLVGTWIWIGSYGGIAGITTTPESTGNTAKLVISDDSVKRYLNGNLEFESNYSINVENSDGEEFQVIYYNGDFDTSQYIDLNENLLMLKDRCDDCFQFKYIKE